MSFEHEKRVARRIIAAVEDARLNATDTFENNLPRSKQRS